MAKKLTKAQRRVMRDIVTEAEYRDGGVYLGVLPRHYGDMAIMRKLVKRGFAIYEFREVRQGWSCRPWPTAKGYAALK